MKVEVMNATLSFISIGNMKAKVLPEPVGAQAKHSRPYDNSKTATNKKNERSIKPTQYRI